MEQLAQHIESLIFTSDMPLTLKEIKSCLEEALETTFSGEEISAALAAVQQRYDLPEFAIEVVEIAGGFQFLTKPSFHHTIGVLLKQTTRKRLSRSALETLSIIAYKQPVTKTELEHIRGVNCDYAIQKLLEKELVTIVGRAEGPGRPLEYGTSPKFMDYFGLKSLDDLPKPKEFQDPEHQIGEQAPIEEAINTESDEPEGEGNL